MADASASIREVGILITPASADDERLSLPQQRGAPIVVVDSRFRAQGQCVVRRPSQAGPGPAG